MWHVFTAQENVLLEAKESIKEIAVFLNGIR